MKNNNLQVIENIEMLTRTKRITPEYGEDFSQRKIIEGAWYKTQTGYRRFKDLPSDENEKD